MLQKFKRLIILVSAFLLLAVLILNFFFFQKSEEEAFFEDVQEEIYEIDREFDMDFVQILMEVRPDEALSFENISSKSSIHPFFILDESKKLLYWSDFSVSFNLDALIPNQEYQFIEDPYGTFLTKSRKFTRNGNSYYVVHAFRLFWPGSIQNDYLRTGANRRVFGNDAIQLSDPDSQSPFLVSNAAGIPLFGVAFEYGYQSSGRLSNPAILIFFTSVFLLYFLLSSDFVIRKWKQGRRWQAIGYGSLVLLAFRLVMLVLGFPGSYFNLPLFDPSNFASSWLNSSLGDLLINTLFGVAIGGMIVFQFASPLLHRKIKILKTSQEQRAFFGFFVFLSSLAFFLVWVLPKNLILNSQWAMDISIIPTFGWFEGISFLIVFLWASVYVMLNLTLISLLFELAIKRNILIRYLYIVAVPIGLVLGFISIWLAIAWTVHILFLTAIIRFRLFQNIFRLGLNTFLTFFFASFICAVIAGIATFQTEKEELIQSKIRFANQNLIEGDVMTEFFLGEVFGRIQSDLFIQNRLADPLLSKEPIETKIRRIYLDNYFDQFEVNIRVFSSRGQDLISTQDERSLSELRDLYIKSDYLTSQRGLYFIRGKESNPKNQFVAFVPVIRDQNSVGTVFLELRQLRVQPGSVYPRLLLDKEYNERLDPVQYDYAVYREEELIRNFGSFNYVNPELKSRLTESKLFQSGIHVAGYHHLGLVNGSELILISSPNRHYSYFLGNISLYFVIFIILTFLTILANSLFKGFKNLEINYSTKLQLYLNFAFFFPIIIISIITIGLLANSYREDLDEQYLQKAFLIRSNLVNFLNDRSPSEINPESLEEEIVNLANTVAADLHLYEASGKLIATNRPNIFDKKLLSRLINPVAMAGIVENNQIQLLVDERLGSLSYKSVYLAILPPSDQEEVAILSVPFFESESELNSLIADVMSNIFNAFVVIFILFLIVSYFVSQNLTFPFRLLTQKLKTTNLENNEPMRWDTKDEIGMLVNEYNNMLFKLEASKKVLASTEKESAWREMAKQVAHEIKNPLTPMKLTLQHLLRLQQQDRLEDSSKLKESFETLIHQVDALSGIASSFSTFAKMPLPKNERMNFKSVLMKVLDLFKNDERLDLIFKDDSFTNEIPIQGDDKLFGRVISNLIINGVQAVEGNKRPVINVWLWMTEQDVFLEISDNGKGIPEELRDKIFIPNFSTKSTGSGLGLAIARSGVETAGGKIWFETKIGEGTTFYLTFPLTQ